MNTEQLMNAILQIRPNAEFVIDNGEITWLDKNQKEPTKKEIESGWVAYQAEQAAEVEAKAAAKAAAQAKLATLGLTVEDLTALGL